ncbi:hypothetical protein K469DRAFT_610592 [Zopfia rhizophila CBS 207.26]|uniref:Uncharacterized protein n=1 Tax=Zopfia rhizophila CBS 207.26 TaxID=1314779 RepID=A0A6A6D8M5_9PEZI|nr:hypothetical protein K469DRAFT_610592 [Zopfia rhizophila CBS 207.26]
MSPLDSQVPTAIHTTQDSLSIALITSLLVADIQRLFSEDGVFYVDNAAIGDRVKKLQMKGLPIKSADSLDFC